MEVALFYLNVNFILGTFFFIVGIIGSVLIILKLEGWHKYLPVAVAVCAAIGTGFCMTGQYWLDTLQYEDREEENIPADGSEIAQELDLDAKSFIYKRPETDKWKSLSGLTLDCISIKKWPNEHRMRTVVLSYISPENPSERLYVECSFRSVSLYRAGRYYSSDRQEFTRIFTKQIEGGKIKEVDIWRL